MPHDDHHHDHERHGHSAAGHSHAPKQFGTAFAIGTVLNLGLVIAQVVFGLAAHSMALLLAWGAAWLGQRLPSSRRTDGWGRGTILAALVNAVVLLISVGAIGLEALHRLQNPGPIVGPLVVAVGLGDAVSLAMDGVPAQSDHADVHRYLSGLDGVEEVHDLPIWGLSTTHIALTAHLVRGADADDQALIRAAVHGLHARFGIDHATVQVETGARAAACRLRSAAVV